MKVYRGIRYDIRRFDLADGNGMSISRMKMRRALAAWKRAKTRQCGPVKKTSTGGSKAKIERNTNR
jgi:hypothetical protein